MSLDKNNLEKLSELKRELPQVISSSAIPSQKTIPEGKRTNKKSSKKESPEELFKKLIESSPDGNIPSHLLEPLKKAEKEKLEIESQKINSKSSFINDSNDNFHNNYQNKYNKKKNIRAKQKNNDLTLYSAFERLLLEEEDV